MTSSDWRPAEATILSRSSIRTLDRLRSRSLRVRHLTFLARCGFSTRAVAARGKLTWVSPSVCDSKMNKASRRKTICFCQTRNLEIEPEAQGAGFLLDNATDRELAWRWAAPFRNSGRNNLLARAIPISQSFLFTTRMESGDISPRPDIPRNPIGSRPGIAPRRQDARR